MIANVRVLGYKLGFVFRHKWDSQARGMFGFDFKDYKLGLFFRMHRLVGRVGFRDPDKWKDNLVNQYVFGLHLLICKAWVTIAKDKVMEFEYDEKADDTKEHV